MRQFNDLTVQEWHPHIPNESDRPNITNKNKQYSLCFRQIGATLRQWRQQSNDSLTKKKLTIQAAAKLLPQSVSYSTLREIEEGIIPAEEYHIENLAKIYIRTSVERDLLIEELHCLPLGHQYPLPQVRWAYNCLLGDLHLPQDLITGIKQLNPHVLGMAGFVEIYMRKSGILLLSSQERNTMRFRLFGENRKPDVEVKQLNLDELKSMVNHLLTTKAGQECGAKNIANLIEKFDKVEFNKWKYNEVRVWNLEKLKTLRLNGEGIDEVPYIKVTCFEYLKIERVEWEPIAPIDIIDAGIVPWADQFDREDYCEDE